MPSGTRTRALQSTTTRGQICASRPRRGSARGDWARVPAHRVAQARDEPDPADEGHEALLARLPTATRARRGSPSASRSPTWSASRSSTRPAATCGGSDRAGPGAAASPSSGTDGTTRAGRPRRLLPCAGAPRSDREDVHPAEPDPSRHEEAGRAGRLRTASGVLAGRGPACRPDRRPLHGRRARPRDALRRRDQARRRREPEARRRAALVRDGGRTLAPRPHVRAHGRGRRPGRQPVGSRRRRAVRIRYVELASSRPAGEAGGLVRVVVSTDARRVRWRLGQRSGIGRRPSSASAPRGRRGATSSSSPPHGHRAGARWSWRRSDPATLDFVALALALVLAAAAVVGGWWYHEQTKEKEVAARPRSSSSRRAAAGEAPPAEGRRDDPVADVRLRQPADAPLALQAPAAVPAGSGCCGPAGTSSSRRRSATGRSSSASCKGVFFAVDAKTGEWHWRRKFPLLLGRFAGRRAAPRLSRRSSRRPARVARAACRGRARDAGEGRPHGLDVPHCRRSRRRSSSTAGCTSAPGTTGCTRSASGQGRCVWSTQSRRRDRQLCGLCRRHGLHRRQQRHPTALDARTGALRWKARSFSRFRTGREYFYATPTVAYGRVYAANTDGTRLRLRRRDRATCSGRSTSARTSTRRRRSGDRRSTSAPTTASSSPSMPPRATTAGVREMPAAIHGAPTVMDGLVYFSTCGYCGQHGSRYAKRGPDGTYAARRAHGEARLDVPGRPVLADRRRRAARLPHRADPGLRPRAELARIVARLALSEQARRRDPGQRPDEVRRLEHAGDEEEDEDRDREAGGASQSRPSVAEPDEPGRHRAARRGARAARTGRRRSGRRARRALAAAPRARSR